jgi:hypothetical protein
MTGKTWKVKIIEGDRQGSSAYYPKEALEAGKSLFGVGVRSFENHPSADEKWSQPERRIGDIIGWLSEEATYDGKDLWANLTIKESKRAEIKELAEAGVIGISIRAEGELVEGTNGMELKKFTAVHSVDVVTTAGAGGGFGKLLESERKPKNSEPISEHKKEETELEISKEFIEALESQAKLTNELLEAMKADRDAKVQEAADLAEAERKALEEAAKPKAPTAIEIAGALREAALSPKAEALVLKAVEGGADLAESITAQKELAADILESAGGEGFGNFEDSKELKESERADKLVASIFG